MARMFSGLRLREARLAAGLKPEQLAVRIDRSVWAIHQYERGTAQPSTNALVGLSDVLGTPLDTFFAEVSADAA